MKPVIQSADNAELLRRRRRIGKLFSEFLLYLLIIAILAGVNAQGIARRAVARRVGDRPVVFYDLSRTENGKIAEHWDVVQEIPATSKSGHTML